MHPIKKVFSLISLFLFFLCLCSGCSSALPSSDPLTRTGFYFDTVITINLYGCNDRSLLDDCFSIAEKYENLFSATIASSEISKINQAKGKPVTVSEETAALIREGLRYCETSEGGFDITIGKLSSLWNFSENEGVLPDKKDLAAAVSTVDYNNVILTGNEVHLKNPDASIDLGGIAKGYIADKMKAFLTENGALEGTINLGGNVLCLGPKSDGNSYKIGIQNPFHEQGSILGILEVTDESVVSSGVYQRYIRVDDKIYHHILNPSTGYPYENNLLSVTVICQNSVDGDGLSTTCFSLGLEKGMELIESLEDTEAVFLTEDDKLHCSSGIGDTIPFHPKNN